MSFPVVLFSVLFNMQVAHAFNFHEIYVPDYETADPHETEVESLNSVMSDNTFRSTLEIKYGLTEKMDIAIYFDFERATYENLRNDAVRVHLKRALGSRGENCVETAVEVEAEIPQSGDESYALSGKAILQKDVNRMIFVVVPGYEYVHLKARNSAGHDSESENLLGAEFKYQWSQRLIPSISFIGESGEEQENLLLLGFDYEPNHGLSFSVGFGATNRDESIVKAAVEAEIF